MKRFGSSRPTACPGQRGGHLDPACRRRSTDAALDAGIGEACIGSVPDPLAPRRVIAAH
ncbi:hypothetical protein ACFQZQ_02060 [Lysobacter koreensis]|uniref:Uncharacterized protein n=1 Tax=Lysobacter koreensis TaxID=266122 RepID=A0ABW2YI38_9GAMM